ncbi:MAG: fibronectin type III domain-containing protein, partial [Chitinophagales bacterium]|nr:fibronectin type III domain-containing protein [Chitinophagales bacterium]
SYAWDNGETTATATGLNAGTHNVTVTDNKGCTTSCSVLIGQPAPLTCTVQKNNDVKCHGESNGSATVNPVGGNGGYSYAWDNGETTKTATGLSVGLHNVSVTDSKGCTTSCSVNITEPAALSATETHVDVTTNGGNNGSIDITVTGGTPPYTYLWNDGVTTQDRTGLTAGEYCVTITDAHGCSTSKCITIQQPNCQCTTPTNVTITSLANDQIKVCWDAQQCVQGYRVQYQWKGHTNWLVKSVNSPNVSCVTIDLKGHAVVTVKVAAICSDGSITQYTIPIEYTYQDPCVAPSNLATTNITATTAKLSWTPGTTSNKQKLQYWKVGSPSASVFLNATVNSYNVSGLQPSSVYKWKVKGDCFSTTVQFQTPALKDEGLNADVNGFADLKVYPNPASVNLKLDVVMNTSEDADVTIQLINVLGQVMIVQKTVVTGGHAILNLNLGSDLSDGMYVVRLISGEGSLEKPVIISNDR